MGIDKFRRRAAALAMVAVALLAVTAMACGDDDDDDASPSPVATASAAASASPAAAASASATPLPGHGPDRVLLATTTSTQDSGLLDELEPAFEEATGYDLQVIAVGSGAALKLGEAGDADVLLVHSPAAEKTFMDAGFGDRRLIVMHNDFVIVGPADDPAGVAGTAGVEAAMTRIAEEGAAFISRGDDSGTHARELALWKAVNIDPTGEDWYEESGQGMGATLNIADQRQAYTVTDRATFLALRDDLDLEIVAEGDAALLNIYHTITLNAETHTTSINYAGGDAFASFMVSDEAQAIIEEFGVGEFGEPLFIPDAGKTEEEVASSG